MAQTFKDFIIECEMFPHSKENFELLKECRELELTEKFMEDQAFMLENGDFISSGNICFEEGFFQESVDIGVGDVMLEKFQLRKKSLSDRMWAGLRKLINTFMSFFRKIGNKFDETTQLAQQIRQHLGKVDLTEEDIAAIRKIVDEAQNNESTSFPIQANQPYLNKVRLGRNPVGGNETAKLKNDLAVALSDTVVVADVGAFSGKGSIIGPMPAMAIEEICLRLLKSKGDATKIINTSTYAFQVWANVQSNGMKIPVNTKEIDNLASQLATISDQIDELCRDMEGKVETSVNTVKDVLNDASAMWKNAKASKLQTESAFDDDEEYFEERAKKRNKGKTNPANGNAAPGEEETKKTAAEEKPAADPTPKAEPASASANASDNKNNQFDAISDAALNAFRKIYSALTTSIGQSMKLYTGLNGYRRTVIKGLESLIKSKAEAEKKTK